MTGEEIGWAVDTEGFKNTFDLLVCNANDGTGILEGDDLDG